jgi:diadenosine tetraphosphatase ApaH/serine/threonine PP2A family protein phosphatase
MRYGIFSDIHSNLEAFEAVLGAVRKENPDKLLCAGDNIGYGADPGRCVELLQENSVQSVSGNHDWAVAGKMGTEWFNANAGSVVGWTHAHLRPEHLSYLASLPLTWNDGRVALCHGSFDQPEEFRYVFNSADAEASIQFQPTPVAFIGHSHVPGFFEQRPGGVHAAHAPEHPMNPERKLLVNVGSVGQPRDRDPRAAYCVYDTGLKKLWIRRVAYDIERAQKKIREAGLPEFLAQRLEVGC